MTIYIIHMNQFYDPQYLKISFFFAICISMKRNYCQNSYWYIFCAPEISTHVINCCFRITVTFQCFQHIISFINAKPNNYFKTSYSGRLLNPKFGYVSSSLARRTISKFVSSHESRQLLRYHGFQAKAKVKKIWPHSQFTIKSWILS